MNASPPHGRVTLPWAQYAWDAPVSPQKRDMLVRAFAKPTLDPDDRSDHRQKDVVSLAVVLDLLATRLRTLPAEPAILARAAEQAVLVGLLGGAERDVVCARLLELSRSTIADARAAFVAAFGGQMSEVLEGGPTTTGSVAQALARLTQATTLVVREAEWLLAQRRARSSWQI